MKRISALLLTLAAVLGTTVPVFADVIPASPADILMSAVGPALPVILIIAVLVITALLVRRFTKKK